MQIIFRKSNGQQDDVLQLFSNEMLFKKILIRRVGIKSMHGKNWKVAINDKEKLIFQIGQRKFVIKGIFIY